MPAPRRESLTALERILKVTTHEYISYAYYRVFEQLVLIIVDERIIRDISKVEANYFAKTCFSKVKDGYVVL